MLDSILNTTYTILTSPLLLLTTLLILLSAYIALIIAYRLTFHPLAKYPGPKLAAITDIYLAYYAYRGTRHLCYHRAHEQYGPIVRIGPNQLSFISNSALKQIYGFRSNVKKAAFYDAFPATPSSVSVHSARDKAQHARKRRVMSHAFSDSAIKGLERYILANVRTACSMLATGEKGGAKGNASEKGRDGKEKVAGGNGEDGWVGFDGDGWTGIGTWNVAHWCNWLVFDIMGDLVFGKAFGMLESDANRFAIEMVGNAAHRHLICGTHLTIHNWHLDKILFRKIAAQRGQYMQYSKAQAMSRTKLGLDIDRKDFFYYLLNAKDPETGKGFSMDELWGESNLLIVAGSDTTSTAMAGTFFYLAHNATVLQKLCREIRETFEDVEEIVSGPKLSGCAYLRACIDETMRMTPPVAGALPREVLPGGIDIDGHHIPAGIDVGVPHYAIHHNPDYYPRPFDYIPERWLSDPSANPLYEKLVDAHSAFCPFSIGPRGCIGKGLAYVELTVTIARVLYLYDLRLAPGTTLGEGSADLELGRTRATEYQIEDRFASMKDGPLLQFRLRG